MRLKGRFLEAAKCYQLATDSSLTNPDRADALCGMGMTLRGLCRYQESIRCFNRALRIYLAQNDTYGEAFALYGRGGAERFLGRYDRATADLGRALAISPDKDSEAFTRMALGGLLRMIGDYEGSLEQYTRARRLAVHDTYAKAYAECGIGNALRMLGRNREARRHLDAAERGYEAIGDRVSRPYTIFAQSLMDLKQRRPGRAADARKLFRSTRDHRGLIYVDLLDAVSAIASGGVSGPMGRDRNKHAERALKSAQTLGARLEAAHARLLADYPNRDRAKRLYAKLGAIAPASIFLLP